MTATAHVTFGTREHIWLSLPACSASRQTVRVPDWLSACAARGFEFVFWERKGAPSDGWKGPRAEGWQTRHYSVAEYRDGMQVGVKTGTAVAEGRYLHAVDFDWSDPRVEKMSLRLLPDTGLYSYRASKQPSQGFYTCSSA